MMMDDYSGIYFFCSSMRERDNRAFFLIKIQMKNYLFDNIMIHYRMRMKIKEKNDAIERHLLRINWKKWNEFFIKHIIQMFMFENN